MSSTTHLEDAYICPSFSAYSSDRLSEIAGRVAMETSDADDDFEFAFVREDDIAEVLADDLFRDGRIRQVFPVFKREPPSDGGACEGRDQPESSLAISLSKLFVEEDLDLDFTPEFSPSSEVDSLESVPAGTYCVWRPKAADTPLPGKCEKSKSTGSASKRWNLRGLMRRSRSDGKGNFVFLKTKEKSIGAPNSGGRRVFRSAHEEFYVRSREMKEGDKKKSYLPYRQELVGIFTNVNGLSGSSLAHF